MGFEGIRNEVSAMQAARAKSADERKEDTPFRRCSVVCMADSQRRAAMQRVKPAKFRRRRGFTADLSRISTSDLAEKGNTGLPFVIPA